MLPARRLLSIDTQNMTYCIRIADTPSIGAVVPPDWFGEIAHGSSLYPTEGHCLRVYSSSILSMLKIFIFFFFYRTFFLLVENTRRISYNRNPVNRIPVMAPILAPLFGVIF
jgi:hypothetical protein